VRSLLSCTILFALLAGDATSAVAQRAAGSRRSAAVSGVVTADGRPAAGVPVWLAEARLGRDRVAEGETDTEGRYRFEGVPPGDYIVAAFLAGFYPAFGEAQRAPQSLGPMITLGEGETVEAFDIPLTRGGAITGRVTDGRARPVVGEAIDLQRVDATGDPVSASLSMAAQPQTDDRGIYRAYGLAPGRYLVAVSDFDDQFRQTYFPSALRAYEARVVTILGTEEVSGVDIVVTAMPPVDRFAVRGRVVDAETGLAVAGVKVSFERPSVDEAGVADDSFDAYKATNADGEFRITGVPAGSYRAVLMRVCGPGCEYSAGASEVAVAGEVRDLTLTARRGATLDGQVVLEGVSDRAIAARVRGLTVRATRFDDDARRYVRQLRNVAEVRADGTFRLHGLEPGRNAVFISDPEGASGFTLLRVEGPDASSRRTIAVPEGRDVTGVRLVVGYGTGAIRGHVRFVNGTPGPGVRVHVAVVLADPGSFRSPTVDGRYTFTQEGLLAGAYEVVARVDGVRATKQTVTVPENGVVDVTITIDVSQIEPPEEDEEEAP
jgi:hypothetical protein